MLRCIHSLLIYDQKICRNKKKNKNKNTLKRYANLCYKYIKILKKYCDFFHYFQILEEEKKIKIFHANPIPKFIKNRIKIEPISNNKNEKNQKVNVPNKQIKKNTEVYN